MTTAPIDTDQQVPAGGGSGGRRRRLRGGSERGAAAVGAGVLLAAVLVAWQVAWAAGWFARSTFPAPEDVLDSLQRLAGESLFWESLRVTVVEIVLILLGALVAGGALGYVFWKLPRFGRAAEPFMVSFYAVPIVVYYPVTVVTIGFGSTPIVVLGIVAAAIPMALNTWIGLEGAPAIYARLAASLQCTRRQSFFRVSLPAALPGVMVGVRLATVYAVLVSVAVEFLVSDRGLGYQIRYEYQAFEPANMLAYVATVLVLAALVLNLNALAERRLVGRWRNP